MQSNIDSDRLDTSEASSSIMSPLASFYTFYIASISVNLEFGLVLTLLLFLGLEALSLVPSD